MLISTYATSWKKTCIKQEITAITVKLTRSIFSVLVNVNAAAAAAAAGSGRLSRSHTDELYALLWRRSVVAQIELRIRVQIRGLFIDEVEGADKHSLRGIF